LRSGNDRSNTNAVISSNLLHKDSSFSSICKKLLRLLVQLVIC